MSHDPSACHIAARPSPLPPSRGQPSRPWDSSQPIAENLTLQGRLYGLSGAALRRRVFSNSIDWSLVGGRLAALLALTLVSAWLSTRAFRAYQRSV